jgi:hypothetical protein
MSRLAVRRAITPAAVAVLLSLGACGDSDDAASDTTAPSTTAPATTAAPTSSSVAPATASTTEPPVATSTVSPTTEATSRTTAGSVPTTTAHDGPVIQLTVGDDVSRHAVALGDNVVLVVTGDATDEVHVHGYDLLAELRPDQPATITFVADIPGVFEIELESAHQLLAELEVR